MLSLLENQKIYKTTQIHNRRYLGNKYKLLPTIKHIVKKECFSINSVADIFTGTGVVASAFMDKQIITNDLLYSNYISNIAWFSNQEFNKKRIIEFIQYYNSIQPTEENYMTQNFSDTYFSHEICAKIGYIREDIEKNYHIGIINERERAILITSLLYAMDRIANTCGHYDAYIKNSIFSKKLELAVPDIFQHNNRNNQCYNKDANLLVKEIYADLVYIDPPYNSRQYCDTYHLLENVAKWEKPEVFGVAKKMDRSSLKSEYCTQNAAKTLEELIDNINAKYILFSYNNMANKGNDRSNAKISDEDILRILQKKGTVKVFTENYKAFTTGKSNIQENAERLFLCTCFEQKKIASPMNYTGGKFKLLSQILPLFPKKIHTFVDLFCGGCNVGINVTAEQYIFNDSNQEIMGLYSILQKTPIQQILTSVIDIINQYELSSSALYGYAHYGCDSSSGLGKHNKEAFNRLRTDFNLLQQKDYHYYIMLFVLIVYSFNHQIRFNSKGQFNLPVGKRDFNKKIQKKLVDFMQAVQKKDCSFTTYSFLDFDISCLTKDDFVYIDPPYLISCASYNENGGWTEQNEKELLLFLEKLDTRGIRFALSNILRNKGKENTLLCSWLKEHKHIQTISLQHSYANSNYHTKDKSGNCEEVLIINY